MSEPTARDVFDASMDERRDLQPAIIHEAKVRGWRVYFTWRSDHSPSGFPDLVLCRPPRLLFCELKREDKDPTRAQRDWLEALGGCGVETFVWRPSDLSSGRISAVLA